MYKKKFTGIEPWAPMFAESADFFENNYVKVVDLKLLENLENTYQFTCFVNNKNVEKESDKQSTLCIINVDIVIKGIYSRLDLIRAKREFEVEACRYIHKTKAKKPNYTTAFAKIDLSKSRWQHWFPENEFINDIYNDKE